MEKKVVAAMAGVRFIYSAVQILTKLCLNRGANPFVFVFFRQAVATATIAPVALVSERNNFPSLSLLDYLKLFPLAFCGNTFSGDLSFLGIRYTNAILSTATMNSIPVITFALGVILRKESIKGYYSTILPKMMGVISCIGGVVTMALYKGPLLHSFNHHRLQVTHEGAHNHIQAHPSKQWIMGTFVLVLVSMSWSLFIIFQRYFHKKCPSMLVFTTLLGIFSTMQTFVTALFFERDFSKWKLALAPIDFILYYVSGLGFFLQSWCIKKVGAVIYTMTIPLTLVITIFISSFALGETTDLGSVLGGALMIVGFYCVVLAKQKRRDVRKTARRILDSNQIIPRRLSKMKKLFNALINKIACLLITSINLPFVLCLSLLIYIDLKYVTVLEIKVVTSIHKRCHIHRIKELNVITKFRVIDCSFYF